MSSDRRLMTTAEYAAHRDCSDSYVRRMRRNGRLALDGDLIDVEASDRLLAATSDPVRGGDRTERAAAPASPVGASAAPSGGAAAHDEPVSDFVANLAAGADLRRAMAREREAKAKLAELELGERAGEMVRRREIAGALFTLARESLNRLQLIRSRVKHQLAAATTAAECDQILDAEIRLVCADLQQSAQDLLSPPSASVAAVDEAA